MTIKCDKICKILKQYLRQSNCLVSIGHRENVLSNIFFFIQEMVTEPIISCILPLFESQFQRIIVGDLEYCLVYKFTKNPS